MTMDDGTNMGIDAERAIATILGGDPTPEEGEKKTRAQVRERLSAVPRLNDLHLRIEERRDGGPELEKVEVLYYQGKEIKSDGTGVVSKGQEFEHALPTFLLDVLWAAFDKFDEFAGLGEFEPLRFDG